MSALLLTYEALGFACTQTQALEYLHVQEAAAGFAAFYELYRRYAASLPLEALLRGQTDAGAERCAVCRSRDGLSVVEFLLHSLQTQLCAAEGRIRACVQCGELSEKRSGRGGLCRPCGKAAGKPPRGASDPPGMRRAVRRRRTAGDGVSDAIGRRACRAIGRGGI
ncbi:MAG: hypothetical protein ACLS3C_04915 [Oscillospiraceae bacterium]